jgi:DNA-binding transcriptional MerR regulator
MAIPSSVPAPQVSKPDKLIFKIGEVSLLLGIPTSVIRFWESEFRHIRPKRTESGQRLYRQTDIDRLMEIKTLLYEKRLTIEGCKQELNRKKQLSGSNESSFGIEEIRRQLKEIQRILA